MQKKGVVGNNTPLFFSLFAFNYTHYNANRPQNCGYKRKKIVSKI